jgi:hypothetical protein
VRLSWLSFPTFFVLHVYVQNALRRIWQQIVQGSFIDSYTNNTYKTIFTYNWIVQFCLNSDHVLFVDDDFYVHIPNVLTYLEKKDIDKTGNAMYGRLYYMAKPIRHHDSKWVYFTRTSKTWFMYKLYVYFACHNSNKRIINPDKSDVIYI